MRWGFYEEIDPAPSPRPSSTTTSASSSTTTAAWSSPGSPARTCACPPTASAGRRRRPGRGGLLRPRPGPQPGEAPYHGMSFGFGFWPMSGPRSRSRSPTTGPHQHHHRGAAAPDQAAAAGGVRRHLPRLRGHRRRAPLGGLGDPGRRGRPQKLPPPAVGTRPPPGRPNSAGAARRSWQPGTAFPRPDRPTTGPRPPHTPRPRRTPCPPAEVIEDRAKAWNQVKDIRGAARAREPRPEHRGERDLRARPGRRRATLPGDRARGARRARRRSLDSFTPEQRSTNPRTGDDDTDTRRARRRGGVPRRVRRVPALWHGRMSSEQRSVLRTGFVQDPETRALAAGTNNAGGYTVPRVSWPG